MGLLARFNFVLVGVSLAGLAATGLLSRQMLQDKAREEVIEDARLILEAAIAIRAYTVDQVRPHLAAQMTDVFLPQSVPAFAATETINKLRSHYGDYSYKEATLNPTNPRNRTADWEADVVQQFRQYPEQQEIIAEREAAGGRSLFIARPIQVSNTACLQCHGTPAAAPPSMLKIYGEANGFGWHQGEVVGAQIVNVPMTVPLRHADQVFTTFMISLAGVFATVFVALNLMLGWLIVRPIRRMSHTADRISTGDFSEPEFAESSRDEVSLLGASFNRMRRSLERAMQMINADPHLP